MFQEPIVIMIPTIISAVKDSRVARKQAKTQRFVAEAELRKTVELGNIKLEETRASIASREVELKLKHKHELSVCRMKEASKDKDRSHSLEVLKQELNFKRDNLSHDLAKTKLNLEEHRMNLSHKLDMANLQIESSKNEFVSEFLQKQAEKGVTGPSFAYNSVVAKALLQGPLQVDMLPLLNGLFDQQLREVEINAKVNKREEILNGHQNDVEDDEITYEILQQ